MNDGKIVRCQCGELYTILAGYYGDQSVCSSCEHFKEREKMFLHVWLDTHSRPEWSDIT